MGDELASFSKLGIAEEFEVGETGKIPELIFMSQAFNKSS